MSVYRDIYNRILSSAPVQRQQYSPMLRILKLQEEAGEVAQAYIGFIGANARKGYTHDEGDVAKELADVVITAMVALHDWTDNPEELLKAKLVELKERIEREGS